MLKTHSVVNNVKTLPHTPFTLCIHVWVQENDMTDKRKISDQVLLLDTALVLKQTHTNKNLLLQIVAAQSRTLLLLSSVFFSFFFFFSTPRHRTDVRDINLLKL